MALAMFELLFDLGNQRKTEILKSDEFEPVIDTSSIEVAEAVVGDRAAVLEAEIDRLNLLCEALLRLTVKSGLATPEELACLLRTIDDEDEMRSVEEHSDESCIPDWCPDCYGRVFPGQTACSRCGLSFLKDAGPVAELNGETSPLPPVVHRGVSPVCETQNQR